MEKSATPDRFEIARALREAAGLLGLERGNRFRARAFEGGARAIESLASDLGRLVSERRLREVPGIGPALAAVITELHETGRSQFLDELKSRFPPGVVELSRVPGMTPRRVALVQSALGVERVADLREACERGLLRQVRGFGEVTEKKILDAISRHEAHAEALLLSEALPLAEQLRDFLRSLPGCEAAEVAGSVRRRVELVSNVDLVAAFRAPADAAGLIARHPLVTRVEREEDGFSALRLADRTALRVTVTRPSQFGSALVRATGSKPHVARLEALGARWEASNEAAVYAAAGLPWIPPELREDAGEIEAALAGDRFDDLLTLEDVRGMVHCHTTWSDGRATVQEMARAAEGLGMEYLTVTDHSPTAGYAGGLSEDSLRRQWDEIARVQEDCGIRLLKGTESDILPDGTLDYPMPVLKRFEVVIASIHNRHGMDEDEMTRRLVTALTQPVFKIWGHGLGRLLKRRDPVACRVPEVLDAIASSRAAIEINGDPHRLDLEPKWVREARKRSIPFVVSTDAHSIRELENLEFAVAMARRGGVRRAEVLNTRGVEEFAVAVRPVD